MQTPPKSISLLVHVKRAFGWNLAQVIPSRAESAALESAGVTDPAARRYAAWRRSLLIVTAIPTTLAFALAVLDTVQTGFGEFTTFGVGLELSWLIAAAFVPIACLLGIRSWKRPGSLAFLLLGAWAVSFFIPFVYALVPVRMIYHVGAHETAPPPAAKPAMKAGEDDDDDEDEPAIAGTTPEQMEKLYELEEAALEFVLSGSSYLLLLPAVFSLIPGVLNGCLRIKSLLPAAQLPGWLLVCAAPAFLLLWLVMLVFINHIARNPLLIFGIVLWSGAPIWYSLRGRVFVQSHFGDEAVARIARVKKLVLLTTLLGVALLVTFLVSAKIIGLTVVGFDRSAAVATKIEELSDSDDEVSMEDVQKSIAVSKAFVYALDLSSWRFAVDLLAKILLVTAVFADLVLRATVLAWRNDRALRSDSQIGSYDQSAGAAAAIL